MPVRNLRGEITFGIGDDAIEANWYRQHSYIVFELAEPIPDGPYAGRNEIIKHFTKWQKMLPYEIAGQIINETMTERRNQAARQ